MNIPIKYKPFLFAAALMFVTCIVLGGIKSTDVQASTPKSNLSGQTIRFVAANHMWTDVMKPLIPQFEKKTGIKVKLESYAEDQLNQKLTVELTSGNSDIDVFMTRPIQEKELFYKANWYEMLEGYVKNRKKTPASWDFKDFMPGLVGTCSKKGHLIAVPLTNEFMMLFYRTDLFKEAGLKPPTTFIELEAAAKKLTDQSKGIYGIVARGNMGAAVPIWGQFLWGYGGDFLKDDKCNADSPEAIESLKYYGRLLHNYGPPGVINMAWPQCCAVFGGGKAAMYADGNVMLSQFTDSAKSKIVGKIGLAVFPAGPKAHKAYDVASWGLSISKTSQHKDAAWKFITWATNKANMQKAQLGNVGQSRASAWNNPAVKAGFLPGYVNIVKQTAKIAMPYYAPPMIAVSQARDILGVPVVKSIETGGTGDVRALAKDAAQKVDALLAKEK